MTTVSAVRAEKKKPTARRSCRWLCRNPLNDFACRRSCCLRVTVGREIDDYDVMPRIDGDRIVSWQMTKCDQAGEVVEYSISGDLSECQCLQSRHHPHGKPCRHRLSLRAALEHVGFTF